MDTEKHGKVNKNQTISRSKKKRQKQPQDRTKSPIKLGKINESCVKTNEQIMAGILRNESE
jgi:hypothetical protein